MDFETFKKLMVLTRREFVLTSRDISVAILFFAAPVALIAIIGRPLADMYVGESGKAIVPLVLAAMFSFFSISAFGWAVYREVLWSTDTRLRTVGLSMATIVTAKAIPILVTIMVETVVVIVVGMAILGAPLPHHLFAVGIIMLSLFVCQVGITLALITVTKSVQQLAQATTLIAVVLGALGGSIVPSNRLPGWARFLGHLTPQYWANVGLRQAVAQHLGASTIGAAAALLFVGLGLSSVCIPRIKWTELRAK